MRALRQRSPFQLGNAASHSGVLQPSERPSQGVPVLAIPNSKDRLDSWKEIASYLKRTVRTVQRWERHEGLPIHRHLHGRANSVYAHRSELDDWWNREAGPMEVAQIQALSQAASPRVADSQEVNTVYAVNECRQTNSRPPERFIECVLELRAVGPSSFRHRSGNSCSVLRLRIPAPNLRPWKPGSATREVTDPMSPLIALKGLSERRMLPISRRTRGATERDAFDQAS